VLLVAGSGDRNACSTVPAMHTKMNKSGANQKCCRRVWDPASGRTAVSAARRSGALPNPFWAALSVARCHGGGQANDSR
jgi:hypothetical protein